MKVSITLEGPDMLAVRKLLRDLVEGTLDVSCLRDSGAIAKFKATGCTDDFDLHLVTPNTELTGCKQPEKGQA